MLGFVLVGAGADGPVFLLFHHDGRRRWTEVNIDDTQGPTASKSLARRCWIYPGATLVALALLAALFFFDPAHSSVFPSCPFHLVTGLHCPGCGSLRAVHQLLHGNLPAAFSLNALMMICLPPVGYACLCGLVRAVGGRNMPGVFLRPAWIWTLLGVIVLYWILRNIPLYPFSWLAP